MPTRSARMHFLHKLQLVTFSNESWISYRYQQDFIVCTNTIEAAMALVGLDRLIPLMANAMVAGSLYLPSMILSEHNSISWILSKLTSFMPALVPVWEECNHSWPQNCTLSGSVGWSLFLPVLALILIRLHSDLRKDKVCIY